MGLIRFLLALSVVIVHSSPLLGLEIIPGSQAVHSFYIISGFYMTMIFVEKYEGTERPLYYFFSNRVLRLYPLYLLVIILTVLLSLPLVVMTLIFSVLAYHYFLLPIDRFRASRIKIGKYINSNQAN